MKEQNQRKNRAKHVFSGLLLFLLVMALSVPAFAANKSLRMKCSFKAAKENESEQDWEYNTFVMSAYLSGRDRMTNSMSSAAKIIIPASFVNEVQFNIGLELAQKSGDGYIYKGTVHGRYWFSVVKREKGVAVDTYDEKEGTNSTSSKYATVKKFGDRYILTIKKSTFFDWFFDGEKGGNVPLNTKTKYVMNPLIQIHGDFPKKASGTIEVDELTLKTKNSHKITFNKNDYAAIKCYRMSTGKTQKSSIVNVKK